MAVRVCMTGDRASFGRPEFNHDLISYDLITPHAARGVLDAIYWRPGMTWVIDSIHVRHPIRRECIEQNGRRILMLRDVAYWIDAHFDLAPGEPDGSSRRHISMFERAMRAGPAVFLGRADFVGQATLVDPLDSSPPTDAATRVDHGWLFHGIDFAGDRRRRYFRAEAIGGVVRVPTADSPLLFC